MTNSADRLQNVLLVILAAGIVLVGGRLFERQRRAEASARGLPVSQGDWKKYAVGRHRSGPQKAPVTVVEFFDYQCPYCARFVSTLDSAQAAYPGDVNVILRHYPLSSHTAARAAAEASECAAEQADFFRAHRVFFSFPESVTAGAWWHMAHTAGARDSVRFHACLTNRALAHAVSTDSLAGEALGVKGTPTILVNDQRFDGAPTFASLDRVIREQRQRPPK